MAKEGDPIATTFEVGATVYAPTYGSYGVIVQLEATRARVSMREWGLGVVELELDQLQHNTYATDRPHMNELVQQWQRYAEALNANGLIANNYTAWIEDLAIQLLAEKS